MIYGYRRQPEKSTQTAASFSQHAAAHPFVPTPVNKLNTAILCMIVAVISLLAFRYEPTPTMDLGKYYAMIESGNVSHLETDVYGDTQTADAIIPYVIRKLVKNGMPSHTLGAFAAALYFGLTAKISLLWCKFCGRRLSPTLLFFVFIFSGYFLGFTGLRQGSANLIFLLSLIYFEIGEKKTALILSILSFFVHFSLIPVVAIFWASVFFSKKIAWGVLGLGILLIPWMLKIALFVQGGFYSVGLAPIARKMDAYIFESYGVLPQMLNYLITGYTNVEIGCFWSGSRWWVVLNVFSLCIFAFSVFFMKREHRLVFRNFPFEKFGLMMLGFIIFMIQAPAIPMRMMGITQKLCVLFLISLFGIGSTTISKLYFIGAAILAILATISGQEIISFIKGGY